MVGQKVIPDFSRYTINHNGTIRIGYSGKKLKPSKNPDGYLRVNIRNDDGLYKTRFVHRLVLISFKGLDKEKAECNHINEIKNDNRLSNLEWVTRLENHMYGTQRERQAISQSKSVVRIGIRNKEYSKISDVIKDGFDTSSVVKVCKGKRKSHKGYNWKYKENIL